MGTEKGGQGQCISERHSETYQSLLSKKIVPSSYDLTHVPSTQLSSLPPPPFFFLPSKTNVSSQVFWSLCLPKGSTGFVSGPGGGTVVNAVWLTDSHLADSGSDWPSPRSGHMAAEYSSLHPFLVLSPTVPFCCTRRWEWVLGFVSCFQFTPVRQLSRRACCVSQGWL